MITTTEAEVGHFLYFDCNRSYYYSVLLTLEAEFLYCEMEPLKRTVCSGSTVVKFSKFSDSFYFLTQYYPFIQVVSAAPSPHSNRDRLKALAFSVAER
jgi:hypothetical protein